MRLFILGGTVTLAVMALLVFTTVGSMLAAVGNL
jgi:hypothetical protein